MKLLFRIEVTGREFIPRKGGLLLVSNHASYVDPVVLGVACPRPLYFFARWGLFQNPLFGALIRALHAFPVRVGRTDKEAILESIEKLIEGKTVVLFPEGSRSWDGSLRQGHTGAGLLAVRSRVPVLPVYIQGSHEALPRGAKMIRPKKISVHFGKPLSFHHFTEPPLGKGESSDKLLKSRHDTYQKIADQLMQAIRQIKDLTE